MKVAVIGSGVMGGSIAQLFSTSENVDAVYLLTRSADKADRLIATAKKSLKIAIRRKLMDELDVDAAIDKLTVTDQFDVLSNCSIILEVVPENYGTKKETIEKIAQYASDDAIVATNTSSLSITELSNHFKNPENFIGMHFFNPATMMKLVEIVVGYKTSDETRDKTIAFVKDLGKEPVMVNEAPGFIVNRMLMPMINEAISMLAEGVAAPTDIDKAMKLGANHPMGPLALSDFIGNDVVLKIMETLYQETGDPKYRPHPLLRKIVRANCLGKKTKKGFFDY